MQRRSAVRSAKHPRVHRIPRRVQRHNSCNALCGGTCLEDLELRRQESARLKWFVRGTGAAVPSTDLIELGGIPYRRSGAIEEEGRGGNFVQFERLHRVRERERHEHRRPEEDRLRHELARRLSLRRVPELHFEADAGAELETRIERLLQRARKTRSQDEKSPSK